LDITISLRKEFHIYFDNRSVVDKIRLRRKLRRTVNQHRYPDVNLELQIIHKIQEFESAQRKITLDFVKSHQDKHKQLHKLTFEEYLNTLADKLTHKARSIPRLKHYYSFPANPVNFIINNKHINSNYPQVCSSAFHSLVLREHLLDKKRMDEQHY
jgi:hypothetical protein